MDSHYEYLLSKKRMLEAEIEWGEATNESKISLSVKKISLKKCKKSLYKHYNTLNDEEKLLIAIEDGIPDDSV